MFIGHCVTEGSRAKAMLVRFAVFSTLLKLLLGNESWIKKRLTAHEALAILVYPTLVGQLLSKEFSSNPYCRMSKSDFVQRTQKLSTCVIVGKVDCSITDFKMR